MLVGCVVVWSLNFTVTKYAIGNGFEPLAWASTRFAISTVSFVLIAYAILRQPRMERRDTLAVVLWGALAIATNQIGFGYSFRFASAATIALLFGTLPIFAGILSQLWGIERLDARRWTAAAVSFTGVALVAMGATSGLHASVGGILLALYAPASFAFYSIGLSPLVRRYGAVRVSAIGSAGCLPVLAAAAAPDLARTEWDTIPGLAWAGIAYSALLAYVVTNILWFVCVDRVGTARASVYVNFQPFLGAIFALALLSERVSALQWAGGAVIAAGIALSRLGPARGAAPVATPAGE
jgi:drug/metabolite transporter (DMT)-like permease